MTTLRIPTATYRVQFNAGFRFADAQAIVAYLDALGISDLYSSPILKACRGSTHGYDVVDAFELNPELGSEADFEELTCALRRLDLGLVVDVVPNHMAASSENVWWMNVLENGPLSRFVNYFDIEWTTGIHGATDKRVLLPILGKPYGEILEGGELRIGYDADGFFITYYARRLPITPLSYTPILREALKAIKSASVADKPPLLEFRELVDALLSPKGKGEDPAERVLNSKFLKNALWRLYQDDSDIRSSIDEAVQGFNGDPANPASFDPLDSLLEQQWYRLAYWRVAAEEINYRRFFDVTDLIGVRVEDPEVFEARQARILQLVDQDKITGLRIDHIDGLYDPIGHLRKLQSRLDSEWREGDRTRGFYTVVEKILGRGEELPVEFAAQGTTGYDFIDVLTALQLSAPGLRDLQRIYVGFTGNYAPFEETAYLRKKQVINELFAGEVRALAMRLARIASQDRNARDFALAELVDALSELTAALPVYRTYVRNFDVGPSDRQYLDGALDDAQAKSSDRLDARIFSFLHRVLSIDPPRYSRQTRTDCLDFIMRWQQFTGRVMAKGVEDTAFYHHNLLISMNEVGGAPRDELFEDGALELHQRNAAILQRWPHTMNATSTHDTKRSEDARARINVLSEIPEIWEARLKEWAESNASRKLRTRAMPVPDANEEVLIYQSLLGIWPLEGAEQERLGDRLKAYIEKASREAKVHTSWLQPNHEHETALKHFVDVLLDPLHENFRKSFLSLHQITSYAGFINSLSQVLLKITSPGVPDFYQGSEFWDFSLVDPDNRRSVNFEARRKMLEALRARRNEGIELARELVRDWKSGAIKMFVTHVALKFRREQAELFRRGEYLPVAIGGDSTRLFGFARRLENRWTLQIVPRFIARHVEDDGSSLRPGLWDGIDVTLPEGAPAEWTNLFTGERLSARDSKLLAVDLLAHFPVALLSS
ncbi:MAG TPA: malto-oligosyltrehalose synthase [Thermoanaerobaculia bacterium]|nr:malto-oligosyltrehalose synthase [Thermoanaerobaculia bacterium]